MACGIERCRQSLGFVKIDKDGVGAFFESCKLEFRVHEMDGSLGRVNAMECLPNFDGKWSNQEYRRGLYR